MKSKELEKAVNMYNLVGRGLFAFAVGGIALLVGGPLLGVMGVIFGVIGGNLLYGNITKLIKTINT